MKKLRRGKSTQERFWMKVKLPDTETGCMEWTAAKTRTGHGAFGSNGKSISAHRYSYELAYGPILPSDKRMSVDHLCLNPRCVRPDHLEVVTQQENVLRGNAPTAKNARKTHCKRGHEFTVENTKITNTGRQCVTCYQSLLEKRRQKRAENPKTRGRPRKGLSKSLTDPDPNKSPQKP